MTEVTPEAAISFVDRVTLGPFAEVAAVVARPVLCDGAVVAGAPGRVGAAGEPFGVGPAGAAAPSKWMGSHASWLRSTSLGKAVNVAT
nr:hypothetical protein [Corynebacterium xerosis]